MNHAPAAELVDSAAAWRRLWISLALSTIGGVGIWSMVVVLPAVQAEFGVARADAAAPYVAVMVGFTLGGILMGRLADRFGVVPPLLLGALALGAGYAGSALAPGFWAFVAAQGVLVGMLGSAATFAPLVADVSRWFARRRGAAVGIVASGNYLAGTVWPPVIQFAVEQAGWRWAMAAIGGFCLLAMPPLALAMRRPAAERTGSGPRFPAAGAPRSAAVSGVHDPEPVAAGNRGPQPPLSPNALQALLMLAGVTCCLAMAMPQVHIVAYCGDLGYGPARGAEMLSLMLGFGVVSRLASGWICDRIGGVRTLILGSAFQLLTLLLYVPFDGLASLYLVSALFGLAQGGIVPSYAIVVRERLPEAEAGTRIGLVLMSTIAGMALGGWLSGAIFDWTGSYRVAFLNGVGWNLVNLAIAVWLLRAWPRGAAAPLPAPAR
jgi:MFS family permease